MKIRELRAMGEGELKSKMIELKLQLIKDNAQVATGTTPKSPGQIKNSRKTIAKILTILKDKKREVSKKHE